MDNSRSAPTLLVVLLIFIVITVFVILLRTCCFGWLAKKKAQLVNQQLQSPATHNSQVRSTSSNNADWRLTDHQIVFEQMAPRTLRNIPRSDTTTPATQIVQGMAEQFRLESLQMNYERRAQERRDVLDRLNNFIHMPPRLDTTNGVTHEQLTDVPLDTVIESREVSLPNDVAHSTPAPRYIAEDDGLPSYEAAIATANIKR